MKDTPSVVPPPVTRIPVIGEEAQVKVSQTPGIESNTPPNVQQQTSPAIMDATKKNSSWKHN
jgi:hypothetical protein